MPQATRVVTQPWCPPVTTTPADAAVEVEVDNYNPDGANVCRVTVNGS